MSAPEPRRAAWAPLHDRDRLAAVRRLEPTAMGSRALRRLSELALRVLDVPASIIALLGEAEVAVSGAGLPPGAVGRRVPLEHSICLVMAASGEPALAVTDAAADPRLAGIPAVSDGRIGAVLGMPLTASGGQVVGGIGALTRGTREWSPADEAALRQLADAVVTELELSALSHEFEAHRLRFELAIDAAEIGSFDWDLTTGRLIWDDRLVGLFGYERESFDETIEAFNSRLHPDDLPRVGEAIRSAVDSCGTYDAEFRIVLPTGETRWVHARGRALADDGATAVRLVGAAYDTTAQRHGDARVARVLESMNAAFFALDRDWRFSYVNAEAERVLHRTREELLGGDIWELFPAASGSDFEVHYRGAAATGEQRVFEAHYPAPLDAWYEVRAWPNPDGLSVYFLDITERRAAEERARRSAARLALIAEVSAALTASLGMGAEQDVALRAVGESVVPALADFAIVSLVEADGRVRDVGTSHRDPAMRPVLERYSRLRLPVLPATAPVVRALSTGAVVVERDTDPVVLAGLPDGEVTELYHRLAPRSAVALPLVSRGRIVGALTLCRAADRDPLDAEDLATARELVDRTALALDNARLHDQQRRLAEALQRSMLTAPPEPDHAEIVVRYHPALEVARVGGDWYDAFLQPDGSTVLVIGDVVGHDTEAAAAMGQLRGLLRGIAYREGTGPAEVLSGLDAAMAGLEVGAMATAAVVRIEQDAEQRAAGTVTLRWSNAGHPPPLVLHLDGRIEELSGGRPELMLGVDPTAERTDRTVTVQRGSTVLLYTDGLVEGRDLLLDDGIALAREVLAASADRSLGELCDELIRRLRPGGLTDDVALVALRLHRQDRPRPASAGPRHVPPGVPAEPEE